MSQPQVGRASGNSSPTLANSLAQAIRDVSCERGFWVGRCGPSTEPKRCTKEMAPSRGRAAASIVTPAAALSSRTIFARKIFVRAPTASGRSARKQRRRENEESRPQKMVWGGGNDQDWGASGIGGVEKAAAFPVGEPRMASRRSVR